MQLKYSYFFFIGLLCGLAHQIQATVFGADNNVNTALAFFTFPNGQANNRLANYGWAPNGFALAASTTAATFDSVFPVSGPIQMNGGTLTLNRDLLFSTGTTLTSLGAIVGQGHSITLPQGISSLPSSTSRFQETQLYLNSDITLSSSITFTGTCYIEGNGHQLILGANGGIKVGNNSTLLMHNVIINGVSGTNVQCLNDFALLILDNCTWIQTANSSFVLGALQFRNNVMMAGNATFAYQTLKTSLITSQATLMLDQGFTFSYDPIRLASQTLLQFSDQTAALFLNGATMHATTTGMTFTHGSMFVRGDSELSSEKKLIGNTLFDPGITLGDGSNAANDFICDISSGAHLLVATGSINYKNVNSSSWLMENSVSQLIMGNATTLRLYKTLNLGLGTALCNPNVTIARKPQAQLLGGVSAVANLFFAQL